MRKLTTEEFKEKYREKYGDKYNLDKVVYNGNKELIVITCPIHGDFEARPNDLLMGQGCPACGGTKKLTTEEFIKRASYVHNNYFTYDKTVYLNANSKVIVTCPIHGDFEVKANNHLNGVNCYKCTKEKLHHQISLLPKINSSTKKLTNEEFKRKVYEKYGDIYNLDKVKYVNSRTPIVITCVIHGDFQITPQKLLSGRGCCKCSGNYRYSTQEFIELAKTKHGDKYIYDKTHYESTHRPITVICPIHGEFTTTPSNHLQGKGCPLCHESHMEKEIDFLLRHNGIDFIREQRFIWLGRQSIDFYIPKYKIAIECQGVQHFQPIDFFGGKDGLIATQKRDEKKKELCENNGVMLLYYSNKKYNKDVVTDINELLDIILKSQK